MLTPNGPGGRGSIPALVMRTGLIQPVDPANARRDISARHVADVTSWPVDETPFMPGGLPTSMPQPIPVEAMPSPTTTAVAQTVTATPPQPMQSTAAMLPASFSPSDRHHWHRQGRRTHPMIKDIRALHPGAMHGTDDVTLGEWQGRPLAQFQINTALPAPSAHAAISALRRAAHTLSMTGLAALPPEIVGGPLAALLRGGAVELHFRNGVVVRTAL